MVAKHIKKAKPLIINRKFLFTVVLLSFSMGSYTYSEITSEPRDNISSLDNSKPFFIPDFTGFTNYTGINNHTEEIRSDKFKPTPSEDIMDRGNMDVQILAEFLTKNNSKIDDDYALEIATLYVQEAKFEGVNADLAFAQMCLETGFLNYGGDVDKSQNNFCGLGATGNGAKGLSFSSPEEGIRAHIQHLKAYGSTRKLNKDLVDSRFRFVDRGSGVELKDLTGKWATDKKYDKKIRTLLARIYKLETKI